VRWEESVAVEMITLQELIERYGVPELCKIDVEGYELEVLSGLQEPLPLLSFEYLRSQLPAARACVKRLESLGTYEYNDSPGETHKLRRPAWAPASVLLKELEQPSGWKRSGDIYARLKGKNKPRY
jgi:hypothetical protein